ncbi:MAG: redoxin family protein, partial [Opitutaceae bacterium]
MRAHVVRLLPILALLSGLSAAEPREQLRSLVERFDRLDRDRDGKLSAAETGNASWFARLDRDGDGYITREELQALRSWLERGRGAPEADSARAAANEAVGTALPPPLESPREGPRVLKPGDVGVGRRVSDLAFTDLEKRAGRLSEFVGAKALVIAFSGTGCPLARKYTPALARLEREYGPKGVAFLFINPTSADPVADIRAMITEHGLRG